MVEKAAKATKRYYGYFTLISNEKMDAMTALELYINKDFIGKAVGNIKDRLNLFVSSEKSLDGKLFVEFMALMYFFYLKKHMQEAGLYQNYTIQAVLGKFDIIEGYEHLGYGFRAGEVLTKQKTNLRSTRYHSACIVMCWRESRLLIAKL